MRHTSHSVKQTHKFAEHSAANQDGFQPLSLEEVNVITDRQTKTIANISGGHFVFFYHTDGCCCKTSTLSFLQKAGMVSLAQRS